MKYRKISSISLQYFPLFIILEVEICFRMKGWNKCSVHCTVDMGKTAENINFIEWNCNEYSSHQVFLNSLSSLCSTLFRSFDQQSLRANVSDSKQNLWFESNPKIWVITTEYRKYRIINCELCEKLLKTKLEFETKLSFCVFISTKQILNRKLKVQCGWKGSS